MKKRLIENLLDNMGVHINQKGYKYLLYAVELKLENNDIGICKIYNNIANKYNTTETGVEKAIRHARKSAENKAEEVFNVNYKIDNSKFIALLVREAERNSFLGDIDELHTLKN